MEYCRICRNKGGGGDSLSFFSSRLRVMNGKSVDIVYTSCRGLSERVDGGKDETRKGN